MFNLHNSTQQIFPVWLNESQIPTLSFCKLSNFPGASSVAPAENSKVQMKCSPYNANEPHLTSIMKLSFKNMF